MRVLLVEDDTTTSKSIEMILSNAGMVLDTTDLGEDGLEIGQLYDYDIIILDLMLPDMDGYEVLKGLRAAKVETPVLILSGLTESENKVKGFGTGADDYLTKPFSPRELIARIKALLRGRSPELINEPITISKLKLNPETCEVEFDNKLIKVGPTEFKLLHFFMKNNEIVFSRNQIIDKVWGSRSVVDDRTVDVHIKRLRQCLVDSGKNKLIHTIRGFGYKFSEK